MATTAAVRAAGPAPKRFSTDCDRLSTGERHELSARVQLLLRTMAETPRRVVLGCDEESAWLEWDGPPEQEFEVDTSMGLVEGALDAIEDRVRSGTASTVSTAGSTRADASGENGEQGPASESPPPAAPKARGPLISKGNETPPPTVAPERPASTARRRLGGAGLALVMEPQTSETPALGPRLDVGVGVGPLSFLVSEGVRFGGTDRYNFLIMDLSMGFAYGAPFDPSHPFGILAAAGMEWATGYATGSPRSSSVSGGGTFTLGLRAAVPMSGASVFFGVDGRLRTDAPSIGPYSLELPQLTTLLSVGGALLVDGFVVSSKRYAAR